MNRTRLSTTVDTALLKAARGRNRGRSDAALIDDALSAFLVQHRAAEIDASYAAYDRLPLDAPDEWGDLESFRRVVGGA